MAKNVLTHMSERKREMERGRKGEREKEQSVIMLLMDFFLHFPKGKFLKCKQRLARRHLEKEVKLIIDD